MRELVQTHAQAGVQEESLLIPLLWEIRYAGNADRCGVALFFFPRVRLVTIKAAFVSGWGRIFIQFIFFCVKSYFRTGWDISTPVALWPQAKKSLVSQGRAHTRRMCFNAVRVVAASSSHLESQRRLRIWTSLWFMHRHTLWSHSLIPPLAGTRTWWQFKTFFSKLP